MTVGECIGGRAGWISREQCEQSIEKFRFRRVACSRVSRDYGREFSMIQLGRSLCDLVQFFGI